MFILKIVRSRIYAQMTFLLVLTQEYPDVVLCNQGGTLCIIQNNESSRTLCNGFIIYGVVGARSGLNCIGSVRTRSPHSQWQAELNIQLYSRARSLSAPDRLAMLCMLRVLTLPFLGHHCWTQSSIFIRMHTVALFADSCYCSYSIFCIAVLFIVFVYFVVIRNCNELRMQYYGRRLLDYPINIMINYSFCRQMVTIMKLGQRGFLSILSPFRLSVSYCPIAKL